MRAVALAFGAGLIAVGGGLATPLAPKVFPGMDAPWMWIGVALIALGFVCPLLAFTSRPDGASASPLVQSVRSFFQFGGVTAHTVHMEPAKRSIGDASLRGELERAIHQLDPTQPVTVMYPISDNEAAELAHQISSMLEQQGADVSLAAGAVPAPKAGVRCYPDTNTIFVGPKS